jgi:hypothetical protein
MIVALIGHLLLPFNLAPSIAPHRSYRLSPLLFTAIDPITSRRSYRLSPLLFTATDPIASHRSYRPSALLSTLTAPIASHLASTFTALIVLQRFHSILAPLSGIHEYKSTQIEYVGRYKGCNVAIYIHEHFPIFNRPL